MASQTTSVLIYEIFNSRKHILELMESQGFNTNDYANFSINEVNSMKQNNQLDILLETDESRVTVEKPKQKIYIRYYLNTRPNSKTIQEMIDDLFVLTETLTKNDALFIIVKFEPNDTLINEIKHIWESEGIYIVIENIKRLQYNILKHSLVPPHRIMTDSEVKTMMNKYNVISLDKLPEISRFDPVARAICMRPGQVCHIIRPSKTSITADYYRVCI